MTNTTADASWPQCSRTAPARRPQGDYTVNIIVRGLSHTSGYFTIDISLQSFRKFPKCCTLPPKQRAANEKRKGGKAKKKSNRVPDEPEEQPFIEEEEEAETQPDAEDEDEESPALQRIVEFCEAHPYFYNLRHEKYRNTKLKEAGSSSSSRSPGPLPSIH